MRRSNKKDSQAYDDYLNFESTDESAEWDASRNYKESDLEHSFHEENSIGEKPFYDERPESNDEPLYNDLGQYRSRQDYLRQLEESSAQYPNFSENEELSPNDPSILEEEEEEGKPKLQRAKYSAKVDRFLTNGIIIVTVLLIAVLLIAFLV